MTERWRLLVQRADEALLEGRFRACERLAAQAGRLAPSEAGPALVAATACREQGRAAEAEILLRDLLTRHAASAELDALLAAVLADLGRDADAGRQLDRLALGSASPEVAALAAETGAVLNRGDGADALLERLLPHAGRFLPRTGAVTRALALLCHVQGRWDAAAGHFDAALADNRAAGAPVLVAHTERQYSGLLRARGSDGDWERAIELLSDAAAVYRRLEIDSRAEEAEAVLRRSQDHAPVPSRGGAEEVFRPTTGGWELGYGGRRVVVAAGAGLGHVAALVAAAGRPVHVMDLVLADGLGAGAMADRIGEEYRSRLADLEAGAPDCDPVAASLARAESDLLRAELAGLGTGGPDAGASDERARRLVALRIRTSLDRVEEVLPALAHHLRRGIRTGTFCIYEPDRPTRWRTGP